MRQVSLCVIALLLVPIAVCAQDLNEQLLTAARKGDVPAARALLEKGADVNAKTRYGATPLSYACDRGNTDLVRLLIEKGANVDARDTFYGATPIIWAAQKGNGEIVKLLLEKGAKGKDDAMSIAISDGLTSVAKGVLDSGPASQDLLDNWITAATRAQKAEIVELLKKAGGKPVVLTEFKISADTLQTYSGTFRNDASEFSFSVKEAKLVLKTVQRDYVLTPTAQHTFEAADIPGVKLIFDLVADRVASVILKQPGAPDAVFKKVEAK